MPLRGWDMGSPLLLMIRKKRNDRQPWRKDVAIWSRLAAEVYEALGCPGRCLNLSMSVKESL